MAKDVAKLIWQLAEEDANWDRKTLKEMYLKSTIDKDNIRKQLKMLVGEHIKTNVQSTKLSLEFKNIYGALARLSVIRSIPDSDPEIRQRLENDPYTFILQTNEYYTITNKETKFLIDHAIIPLDLEWWLVSGSYVLISWSHWGNDQ